MSSSRSRPSKPTRSFWIAFTAVLIFMSSSPGVTFNASANQASGNGAGQDVTHTHSAVTAGKVLINSGGDTHIKGATVTGHSVSALVGGALNITSLQDTSSYKETSSASGFGVSLCIPPLCIGASGASISASKSHLDSNCCGQSKIDLDAEV